MFTTLLTFRLIMFLLLLPLFVCWRILKPKKPMGHFTALILKEMLVELRHQDAQLHSSTGTTSRSMM